MADQSSDDDDRVDDERRSQIKMASAREPDSSQTMSAARPSTVDRTLRTDGRTDHQHDDQDRLNDVSTHTDKPMN